MAFDLREQLQAQLGSAYTIERELGGGGMSHVFLAEEVRLGRTVVVKVLPPLLAAGLSSDRFEREIHLAAKLQHPHIVPLLTAGSAGDILYYVMPHIEGESLRARLAHDHELPVGEVVRILRDVVDALAYAHAHGVVHRDIKPANVLLSGKHALVTDFGVAKALTESTGASSLTSAGVALGTPAYMAPEQAVADPQADHRVDIYALGVVAYEMLAGHPPFVGASSQQVLAAQVSVRPQPLTAHRAAIPATLADLVMSCLEKHPADRPQYATALLHELEALTEPSGRVAMKAGAGRLARRRVPLPVVALSVVVLVGAVALWRQVASREVPSEPGTSIAVLPFVNTSGDRADDYFSDGITDEVSSALGKVAGLHVASRTSAYVLKGRRDLDVREIGRRLNVATVLEGAVRRGGNRLRVTVQLTKATDGLAIWSETYERQFQDLFQVQDDITRSIVGALRAALGSHGPASAPPPHPGTENLAAYDLYLRGRYLWRQRGGESLRRAAASYERAIALDPRFARAHAGLAEAVALLPLYAETPAESAFAVARRAAEGAITLDSSLADPHTTLGLVANYSGDRVGAEREFERAITLDPNEATAHQWYGEVLYRTGRVAEAVTEMRRAYALDSFAPVIAAQFAYVLALSGRFPEAIEQGRRAVALDPSLAVDHMLLGRVFLMAGRKSDAVDEFEANARLGPDNPHWLGFLAYSYAVTKRRDQARALLDQLERRAPRGGISPSAVGLAYLGLGDVDQALTWLERAADTREPAFYLLSLREPFFDSLRAEPRFIAFATRLGVDARGRPAPP